MDTKTKASKLYLSWCSCNLWGTCVGQVSKSLVFLVHTHHLGHKRQTKQRLYVKATTRNRWFGTVHCGCIIHVIQVSPSVQGSTVSSQRMCSINTLIHSDTPGIPMTHLSCVIRRFPFFIPKAKDKWVQVPITSIIQYRGWKKSCTSWYGTCPIIYKASYMLGGAGFLPSTVYHPYPVYRICLCHECYTVLSTLYSDIRVHLPTTMTQFV